MSLRYLSNSEWCTPGQTYGAVVVGRGSCQSQAFVNILTGTDVAPLTGVERWGTAVEASGQIRVQFAFEVRREMQAGTALRIIGQSAEQAQAQPTGLGIVGDPVRLRGAGEAPDDTRDPLTRFLDDLKALADAPKNLALLGAVGLAIYLAWRYLP